jgi:ABC-type amino acid transport substrate-binding protein
MSGAGVARKTELVGRALALTALLCGNPSSAASLTVCVAADNAPLSWSSGSIVRGLDLRIATALAQAVGRELVVLPFETSFEKDSALTNEVNALLSAGLCDAASGFPLLASDLGPAGRPTSRTPGYPGAKRMRERPFVPLGTLVASRAYLAVSLGLVQRPGSPPLGQLSELGDRRLGAVSGTLASAVALGWKQGVLRPKVVSLSLREDALAELAKPTGSRIDAAFVPLALYDGWQLTHPGTRLVAADYRRAIGINLGFVTLAPATELRAALDKVIVDALADGSLARWAREEGVSWSAPVAPDVSRGPSLAELIAD